MVLQDQLRPNWVDHGESLLIRTLISMLLMRETIEFNVFDQETQKWHHCRWIIDRKQSVSELSYWCCSRCIWAYLYRWFCQQSNHPSDFKYLSVFGRMFGQWISFPTHILCVLIAMENLYVADENNRRIQSFSSPTTANVSHCLSTFCARYHVPRTFVSSTYTLFKCNMESQCSDCRLQFNCPRYSDSWYFYWSRQHFLFR